MFKFNTIDLGDLIVIISLCISMILAIIFQMNELSMSIASGLLGYIGGVTSNTSRKEDTKTTKSTTTTTTSSDSSDGIIKMSNLCIKENKDTIE